MATTPIQRGAPDAALIYRATAYHPKQCGHGVTWAEDCPECAAVWREGAVKHLSKQAAKYGLRLTPIEVYDPEAAERCYMAGWTDMRALACNMIEEMGRPDLSQALRETDPPPSGDK